MPRSAIASPTSSPHGTICPVPHSLYFACSITCSNQARKSDGTNYETAQDRHSFGRVHGPHRMAGLLGARPDKLKALSPSRTDRGEGIIRVGQGRAIAPN